MKRFAAFLLLTTVIAQAFWNLGVIGYWVMNRDFIAKNLCINRDKPASCCEGKCYLEKNLLDDSSRSAQENQSASEKISLEKGIELADLPADLPFFISKMQRTGRSAAFPPALDWVGLLREKGIFRPPAGDVALAHRA